jgi:hypothetical protein
MELSINRLCALTTRHLLRDGKKYLFGILGAILLVILVTLATSINSGVVNFRVYFPFGLTLFMIGGVILTTNIFSETNKLDSGYQLMTLPVSNLERLISSWLVSFLIYTTISFSALFIGMMIIKSTTLFGLTLFQESFPFEVYKYVILAYFGINALGLLGGATFKKNATIKTIVAFSGFSFAMSLVSVLVMWILSKIGVFPDMFNSHTHTTGDSVSNNAPQSGTTVMYIYFYAMTVFFWIVSYFKLKERTL